MAWAPDYCTAQDLADYARIPDSADNAQIALAVTAASRAIDQATNRQFGLVAAPEARYYTASYDRSRGVWDVPVDDLMTETGLLVAYDITGDQTYTASVTDYRLAPWNAQGRPWVSLRGVAGVSGCEGAVKVTARWGWTSVPDPIKQATLMQASRFLMRRDAPFGVAGSPDAGSELRLLAKIDPDVAVIVGSYTRWWGAV